MPARGPGSRAPATRPDESMTLLLGLMEHPLEEEYARAAERRAANAGHGAGRGTRPGWWSAAALVLIVALLVTAAFQARRSRPAAAAARDALIARVHAQTAATDRLGRRVERVRAAVDADSTERLELTRSGSATADQLARLGLAAEVTAVHGPGLEVVVDDAPADDDPVSQGDPRTQEAAATGRVLDVDVQRLVNGLWSAGAEAVSINGQRLTALTAIRSAGEAILVDYRPLTRPYAVLAIGNPNSFAADFADSSDGRALAVLASSFGIRFDVTARDDLTVPAASAASLRFAKAGTRR